MVEGTSFGDYARVWLDNAVHLKPGTADKYRGHLKLILSVLGDKLDSIQPSQVRSFVAVLSRDGLAPATVQGIYRTFSQIMSLAEGTGSLRGLPAYA